MDIMKITFIDMEKWWNKFDKLKKSGTIGEGKKMGREFRDKYNLTDRQATDILFRKTPILKAFNKPHK